MIEIRPFETLGHVDHGWLNAHHHFSFSDYHDPGRMGWGAIRVWNDDEIKPNTGFPPHPHANMEIITYVRAGAISHGDSLGNKGRTPAGDVQVMSAGSGIRHSEFNLEDETTRLFQIWIVPNEFDGAPSWNQRAFPTHLHDNDWALLAGPAGADNIDGALTIRADARVWGVKAIAGQVLRYKADPHRFLYLVSTDGAIRVNGDLAQARDGVAIRDETDLQIEVLDDSDLVMVDSH